MGKESSTGIMLPRSPEIMERRLLNGMRVYVCHLEGLHRESLLLNVGYGCRHERLPGTAHLLEHLIFRGCEHYPSLRALSEAFESYGADFNAFTAREVTSFDVLMPPESVFDVVDLLGEVMSHPRLTGIASERDIIREEILPDYDGDGTLINVEDLLVSEIYGEAGHPIAGNPEELGKLTKSEVLSFYGAHYATSSMMVVMAGPIAGDDALMERFSGAFREMAESPRPWVRREMPDKYLKGLRGELDVEPRLVVKRYDGATQSDVIFGFLCQSAGGEEFSDLEMLVRVLDDGMASRLSRRLVEELALVYDAEAYLSTTQESTLLQIRVSCRHRRVPRLVGAVYEILSEIAEHGVPAEELGRLRRRVVWEHYGLLDGVSGYSQWLSTMLMQGLPTDPGERCRNLLMVDSDRIKRIAGEILKHRVHVVSIVGDLGERMTEEIRDVMEGKLGRGVGMKLI